jgi:hypothetical protein
MPFFITNCTLRILEDLERRDVEIPGAGRHRPRRILRRLLAMGVESIACIAGLATTDH